MTKSKRRVQKTTAWVYINKCRWKGERTCQEQRSYGTHEVIGIGSIGSCCVAAGQHNTAMLAAAPVFLNELVITRNPCSLKIETHLLLTDDTLVSKCNNRRRSPRSSPLRDNLRSFPRASRRKSERDVLIPSHRGTRRQRKQAEKQTAYWQNESYK